MNEMLKLGTRIYDITSARKNVRIPKILQLHAAPTFPVLRSGAFPG